MEFINYGYICRNLKKNKQTCTFSGPYYSTFPVHDATGKEIEYQSSWRRRSDDINYHINDHINNHVNKKR